MRAVQRVIETVTIRTQGEHFCRRPYRLLEELGFSVERRERFTLGIVERLSARKFDLAPLPVATHEGGYQHLTSDELGLT